VILVDSSVWVDHFRGISNPGSDFLAEALGRGFPKLIVGDLILAEVLQGFRAERQLRVALEAFDQLDCAILGARRVATQAARNYRVLRDKGVTVRSTIDCLIATFCIEQKIPLLHEDRDFDPFTKHLGLKPAFAPRLRASNPAPSGR
jgi:predicted nucleic acid-binding protein